MKNLLQFDEEAKEHLKHYDAKPQMVIVGGSAFIL